MHGAQEDNSLSLLQHIAYHVHVAIESKLNGNMTMETFGTCRLPWFGCLRDLYVRLVLVKSPHNVQVLLKQLLSQRDTVSVDFQSSTQSTTYGTFTLSGSLAGRWYIYYSLITFLFWAGPKGATGHRAFARYDRCPGLFDFKVGLWVLHLTPLPRSQSLDVSLSLPQIVNRWESLTL